MGYKGSWKRPKAPHVPQEQVDLQYELIKKSTTPERKVEIKARLLEIKEECKK